MRGLALCLLAAIAFAMAAAVGQASTWRPIIFFNYDRPAPGDQGVDPVNFRMILDAVVTKAKEYPSLRFELRGHTDNMGSDAYNMALSQRRAEYVRAMLVERGIAPERLTVVAKGKREILVPLPPNRPEPQNRRVEIWPK